VSAAGTVEADGQLRLFLALELPDEAVETLRDWSARCLERGRRTDTFHVTLAFLGRRDQGDLAGIVGALRDEAAATPPFALEAVRYRETGSVGMLVLADPSGEATRLAGRLHARLQGLGVYEPERRAWLPHVTVLRFRTPPGLRPPLPELQAFTPSGAAAFISRLHPSGVRYEVLDSCPLNRAR
jgi:2'-5' RNA ligase